MSYLRGFLIGALGVVLLSGITVAFAGDSSYVGSDKWFKKMTDSAKDRAITKSMSKGNKGNANIPADYIEVEGRIVFPDGNPFPGGRLPDLRVKCEDSYADGVERAPFLDTEARFSTVFKRGQTYDFYWMYSFGAMEKFAGVYVDTEGPSRRTLSIAFVPGQTDNGVEKNGKEPLHESGVDQPVIPAEDNAYPVPEDSSYPSPESDNGYKSPESDNSYHSPASDNGYQSPQTGSGYVRPQTGQ